MQNKHHGDDYNLFQPPRWLNGLTQSCFFYQGEVKVPISRNVC